MKACRIEAKEKVAIVDVPYCGDPERGEVVVKIKSAGICGSDMHIYHGTSAFAIYPNIMGHELAGEIHAPGEDVQDIRPGDHVVINNVLSCGECYACGIGRPNVCKSVKVLGVHTAGGFQEYLKISRRNVYRLPEHLDWKYAALIEPYSIASQSLSRGRITDGDRVLICGAGPIGLMILQAAKLHDVKVLIMDIVQSRLDLGMELGADACVNGAEEDADAAVMELTHGEGASLIFEATGSPSVLEACISRYASQAGRLVVLGFSSSPVGIAPIEIMRRELEVIGTRLNNERMPEAISWLGEGKIRPEKLISSVYPLERVKEAFDFITDNPEKTMKVVLKF